MKIQPFHSCAAFIRQIRNMLCNYIWHLPGHSRGTEELNWRASSILSSLKTTLRNPSDMKPRLDCCERRMSRSLFPYLAALDRIC